MKDVVVSGVGVVSPLGVGREPFWASMQQRRSGVKALSVHDSPLRPVRFGAEVHGFDAKPFIRPRKSLKVMCREIQMAVVAANLSIEDAGLERGAVDPARLGVNFGCEMFYGHLEDLQDAFRSCLIDGEFLPQQWGARAMSDIHPLWMLKYLPNMPACHIAIAHDLRGPNNSIALAEASSLLAIAEATHLIQRGGAEIVIAGGTGNRLNLTESILSGRPPAVASVRRSGRGRATLRRVARRHGLRRRRRSGRAGGEPACASAGNPARWRACWDFTARLPRGRVARSTTPKACGAPFREACAPRACPRMKWATSTRTAGPSTKLDVAEAEAIRTSLGDVPVTAPKSYFGNLGAGSGAVELIASILALGSGEVPVTLNYEQPDPRCPLLVVHGQPYATSKPVAAVVE